MAKPATKDMIKRQTIKSMKSIGTYRPEYNTIIDIYAGLVSEYHRAIEDFEKDGRRHEVFTAAGGTKKSGIVATLENLRKDILAYSDRLCLNPKALEKITVEQGQKSPFAQLIESIEKDRL